jgi:hypothetical protein
MISRAVKVIAVTVALLGVMYVAFRGAASRGAMPPPQSRTYRLSLEDQRLVSGPGRIEAIQGDFITLVITSNRAGTLHVHEYEQHLVIEVIAGRETASGFKVDRAGRFGVHFIGADGAHAEIAAVEVQPR